MKKLILTLFGIALLVPMGLTKEIYECAGSVGPVLRQEHIGGPVYRMFEDYDIDGTADAQVTYIFDKKCMRKIRVVKPYVKESFEEADKKDLDAYLNYMEQRK